MYVSCVALMMFLEGNRNLFEIIIIIIGVVVIVISKFNLYKVIIKTWFGSYRRTGFCC